MHIASIHNWRTSSFVRKAHKARFKFSEMRNAKTLSPSLTRSISSCGSRPQHHETASYDVFFFDASLPFVSSSGIMASSQPHSADEKLASLPRHLLFRTSPVLASALISQSGRRLNSCLAALLLLLFRFVRGSLGASPSFGRSISTISQSISNCVSFAGLSLRRRKASAFLRAVYSYGGNFFAFFTSFTPLASLASGVSFTSAGKGIVEAIFGQLSVSVVSATDRCIARSSRRQDKTALFIIRFRPSFRNEYLGGVGLNKIQYCGKAGHPVCSTHAHRGKLAPGSRGIE